MGSVVFRGERDADRARKAVRRGSFDTVKALVAHIGRYISNWNDHPKTFIWTKQPADLIKTVVRRKH